MSSAALKSRLLVGVPVIGTFARIPSPELIEILAHAGLDFVIIDTEHTSFGMETVIELVRAADAAGISPLIRGAENSPSLIAKALDTGSQGVVVPRISTREGAERAVRAARFHPLGERRACSRVRAGNYSAMDSVWRRAGVSAARPIGARRNARVQQQLIAPRPSSRFGPIICGPVG